MRGLEPLKCVECATLHGHPPLWVLPALRGQPDSAASHRAARPAPPSPALMTHWPRSPTPLEPTSFCRHACMHLCMHSAAKRACTSACARVPAETGGLERCRASRPVGLRAGDGGAGRAAWCDAGEPGFPRRAAITHMEGWPCSVGHSAHSRGSSPRHEPSSQMGMDWRGCDGCDGCGRAGCGRRDGGDQDGSRPIEVRLS